MGASWSRIALALTAGLALGACSGETKYIDADCGPDVDGDADTDGDSDSDADSDSDSDADSDADSDGDAGVVEEPELVSVGDVDKLLLRGMVLTPTEAFMGELLIEAGLISCVAPSCADEPGADTASVVETNGIVMPGLIDTHNHILFDIFDEDDWAPEEVYTNHDQWPAEERYGAMMDAKQYLNGEYDSPIDVNCELIKYGELKAIIAGTTAVQGSANPANKVCYRTLARTIDQSANGLCGTMPPSFCDDYVQAHTVFPSSSTADGVCANFLDGDTLAYLPHVGEGVDATALGEFADLYTVTTTDGCLYDPRTALIHANALGPTELATMADNGMGLIWSPRSNVSLYSDGTDYSVTADIPTALDEGIRVSLGPDWSMGGSQNMLDELRFADLVDDSEWGDILSPEELVEMATLAGAENLAVDDQIGSLAVGMIADVVVIGGDQDAPYDAVLAATPREVGLVLIEGYALYGDDQLEPLGADDPGCEAIEICGRDKFLCVAITGGDSTNKFGQTFAEIEAALSTELAAYDDLDLTEWDFWPLTPLVKCEE